MLALLTDTAKVTHSLGTAIVSRNTDLLKSTINEIGNLGNNEIQSIWKEVESELELDEIQWFRHSLSDLFPTIKCEPLSDDEFNLKEILEGRLQNFFASFVERGLDLALLREQKLYREEYPTWELYCRFKLGVHITHADRLIKAAQAVKELQPIGFSILPQNELVARELTRVKKLEDRVILWQKALDSGQVITAESVRRIRLEGKEKPPVEMPSLQPGELVVVTEDSYKNCWGRISAITNNGRYKVQVGLDLITLKPCDVYVPEVIDEVFCERVEGLINVPNPHIKLLTSTFYKFQEPQQWQLELLSFLEGVCH